MIGLDIVIKPAPSNEYNACKRISADECRVMMDVRHKFFDLASFQQVAARPLLTTNSPAEFGDEESSLQGFGESPSSRFPPFMRQGGIFLFDRNDIAGNLDCNSLPSERGSKIGLGRFSVAVEANQRQQPRKHIQ